MAEKYEKEMVTVDARKLAQGLKATFAGVAMVFDSIGVEAEIDISVADEVKTVSKKLEPPENAVAEEGSNEAEEEPGTNDGAGDAADSGTDDAENAEQPAALTAEAETEKESAEEQAEEPNEPEEPVKEPAKKPAAKKTAAKKAEPAEKTITADDVTKIIVQKIKQDRSNNEKIGQILKSYGVVRVSELPASKYESFITDLVAI